MTCLKLLFLCWISSILTVTSCIGVDGYSCVSSYWDTVTCVVNITGIPVGQTNTSYNLTFTDTDPDPEGPTDHCPLVERKHTYSCVCKVTEGLYIGGDYYYDIALCHESGCHPVTQTFNPSDHIQPTPPHKPEVEETPETFNITWISGYEDHMYLKTVFDFELLLQRSQSTESKTLKATSQKMYEPIPRSELKPGATYCIKVRSKTNHADYDGIWSKWSPSTCWKTEAEEEQDNTLVILIKSLVPLCVAVGVMLFLLYSPTARMKIKTLSHTPSPAPFFQPLFQQHGGNLQEWLSPKGKYVLAYKTEEILTTDDVIVVPKPITKEPEENVDYHNPTVHLTFTQGHSSYVGLPGVHEASPPLTMIYPGDMSYTQLPSSVWGLGVGEKEVASSPPEDFLNISCADSGCEDPTQSPECSLPNSPVEDIPPLCYCNDYCILNKTAEGFAPVLVSR
ncbi:hypothetical protein CgunFtcFv8_019352 [Champsocephalus gunnari]|uniref:Fibronectin type-III domain-containing protein n=1 Tax=Champsocephalus gunnari TaxID=52237 RepID=A0AAN8DF81_CHAGU|nr:hypothetical protein CgunFtcFv8_019352 [Champsocephalus gunnari]